MTAPFVRHVRADAGTFVWCASSTPKSGLPVAAPLTLTRRLAGPRDSTATGRVECAVTTTATVTATASALRVPPDGPAHSVRPSSLSLLPPLLLQSEKQKQNNTKNKKTKKRKKHLSRANPAAIREASRRAVANAVQCSEADSQRAEMTTARHCTAPHCSRTRVRPIVVDSGSDGPASGGVL